MGAGLHSVSVTNASGAEGLCPSHHLSAHGASKPPVLSARGAGWAFTPPLAIATDFSFGQRSRWWPWARPGTGTDTDTGRSPCYHLCLWDGLGSGKRDTQGCRGEGRAPPCCGILPAEDEQRQLIPPEQDDRLNTSASAASPGGDFLSHMKGRRGDAGHFSPPDDWCSRGSSQSEGGLSISLRSRAVRAPGELG